MKKVSAKKRHFSFQALEKLKTAESQNQLLKQQQSEEVRKIHKEYQVFETLLKEAEGIINYTL